MIFLHDVHGLTNWPHFKFELTLSLHMSPSAIFNSLGGFFFFDEGGEGGGVNSAVVSTFAGSGQATSVDGNGLLASFTALSSICLDNQGGMFVIDNGGLSIRHINMSNRGTRIVLPGYC